MIDLKNPEHAAPNALTIAALLILAGTFAFMFAVRAPQYVTTGHALQKREKYDEIAKAVQKGQQVRQTLAPKLWQGGSVQVTADILSKLTAEANKYNLTLTSFRPDSQKDLTGFQEQKYTVQVAGTYPQVRRLLASLDGGGEKVALGSVQIAVSPNAQDAVQATVSISAYLLTDVSLLPAVGNSATTRGILSSSKGAAPAILRHSHSSKIIGVANVKN